MPYIQPLEFFDEAKRGTLIEVHIADLHFEVIDPQVEYNILRDQFLNKIAMLKYDILSIDGDIFNKKVMANSDAAMYASIFIDNCVADCRAKGATMVIIAGTFSHDNDQIKLFYHYLEDPTIDIRIIEHIKFEYIKGAKILCIPEEYGKPAEYYNEFLSQGYDSVFMHGTIVGSVYGANKENLNSEKSPVFSLQSFSGCRGPIISGHVHTPGCFEGYMYYCGCPIRYKFGEEEDKGFIILLHNLDTGGHYVWFNPITSFRYDTIDLGSVVEKDPNKIIAFINNLESSGVANIRIKCGSIPSENLLVIKNYFKTAKNIHFEDDGTKTAGQRQAIAVNATDEILNKYKGMDFILDQSIDEMTKFVMFINYNKGADYISVEKLREILSNT